MAVVDEKFFVSYRKVAMETNEVLISILIPYNKQVGFCISVCVCVCVCMCVCVCVCVCLCVCACVCVLTSIIECDSTLYVGMTRKQNGGPIPRIHCSFAKSRL